MSTTPTIEEFEAEATAFLDAHAELRPEPKEFAWGEGSDDVAMFEEVDPEDERRQLAEAKAWRATRFDAGLGYISGPPEHGGRGPPLHRARGALPGPPPELLRHRARHGRPDHRRPRPAGDRRPLPAGPVPG